MKKVNFKEISAHETPGQSPGFLLWQVSTTWRGSIELMLQSIQLTHPQFVILATLGWLTRNADPISQAALGKMANLDPNTVSQILKTLEKKGLIFKKPSSDARAKNPLLTSKGASLLKKALPLVEKKDAEFFQKLSSKEMTSLLYLFQKLIPIKD